MKYQEQMRLLGMCRGKRRMSTGEYKGNKGGELWASTALTVKIQSWTHNIVSSKTLSRSKSLHCNVMCVGSTAREVPIMLIPMQVPIGLHTEVSWCEIFTCYKHKDIQDMEQCWKIMMSLWSVFQCSGKLCSCFSWCRWSFLWRRATLQNPQKQKENTSSCS